MTFISKIISRIIRRDPGAPERLPAPDSLALLARPDGEPAAEFLRGILEQQGVRSMIKNRDAVSARGGGMGPTWAYELWVLRKDLARAREIIGVEDEPADDEPTE
jgi:Putative prokaryotic signal transducing protein